MVSVIEELPDRAETTFQQGREEDGYQSACAGIDPVSKMGVSVPHPLAKQFVHLKGRILLEDVIGGRRQFVGEDTVGHHRGGGSTSLVGVFIAKLSAGGIVAHGDVSRLSERPLEIAITLFFPASFSGGLIGLGQGRH